MATRYRARTRGIVVAFLFGRVAWEGGRMGSGSPGRSTPSERVQRLGADPQLVREVQQMERISVAGLSYVAANGRGLKGWPIERWLLVVGLAANTAAYTFGAGSTWRGLTVDVATLQRDVRAVDGRVSIVESKVEDLRVDTARATVGAQTLANTAGADRTPGFRFPPESHLDGGTR